MWNGNYIGTTGSVFGYFSYLGRIDEARHVDEVDRRDVGVLDVQDDDPGGVDKQHFSSVERIEGTQARVTCLSKRRHSSRAPS